ncbi:hypothetical protein ACF09J_35175 [Streptomyces sp. NPDC014889]|uniref:hypothetical protein n=1 Tax=Streptomyces sp. NPDC014889 TaxID=3364928 RepID=UPI0036F82ED1
MSKSFISISTPAASTPLATVSLSTVNGGRLVAVGKWGPAFEQPPKPKCGDCHDFQQVMVRRGGRLIAVTCQCISTGTGDDLPARIPTGSPKPNAVPAVAA